RHDSRRQAQAAYRAHLSPGPSATGASRPGRKKDDRQVAPDPLTPSRLDSMPFTDLKSSPHADGVSPVSIHYQDIGSGPPLVFLHGGWGYGVYPIDRQIEALRGQVRLL